VSWRKVKAEYIAGGISQRKLAEKYGIPWGTLRKRANVEKWGARRRAIETKALQKAEQKTAEKTAEIVADNAVLCENIKTTLLQKMAVLVESLPTDGTEHRRKENGVEITTRIKDIAAVYAALSDKMQRGQSADIEDLTPLGELLRDE
jgi:hypothetical protein